MLPDFPTAIRFLKFPSYILKEERYSPSTNKYPLLSQQPIII